MTYVSLLLLISVIILAKACICIEHFRVLRRNIIQLFIPKSKLLLKLLSNLDKKITKTKNNKKILLLRTNKMLLPDNFILANILIIYKNP